MTPRFHIRNVQDLRMFLTKCVMREWAHPCIEPEFQIGNFSSYEDKALTRSCFYIRDAFVGDYKVTIEKCQP